MLDRLLDALIGAEAFERLLVERARPILARADAGEDFVVAALARALDAPVLAVAAGPREAEALAEGVSAWLGPEGVALLPSWEALPYEGISPSPEVAARRADAVRRLRGAKGPFVLVAALARRDAGDPPDASGPPRPWSSSPASSSPPTPSPSGWSDLGYLRAGRRRAPRRVRRPRRRRRRVPRHGAASGPARVLGRRDRVAPRVRRPPRSSRLGQDRPARDPPGARARHRRAVRARAAELAPKYLDRFRDVLERIADGLHFEGMESLRAAAVRRAPRPRRAPAGGLRGWC